MCIFIYIYTYIYVYVYVYVYIYIYLYIYIYNAGAFNVAFIAIFLRLSLPRLLAMQSMGDLSEFSKELGLPGREELASYLAYSEG
jgi:hypothetical protein